MRKVFIYLTAIFIFGGICFLQNVDAAIYKYVDNNGVVGFADNLQAVPEQYRAHAVIVEGESTEDDAKPSVPVVAETSDAQPLPSESSATEQSNAPRPLSFRLMLSGLISLGGMLIFIVLSKQPGLKENQKIISHVRTALIGIVSLYLVIAHVKDVMTIFGMAGKAVEDVQQHSAEKGKKAAQAMKQLDALIQNAQQAQDASHTETENNERQ